MVIRENEIFSRLCSVVKEALSELGLTGFEVMQEAQPLQTNSHGCILISRISVRRLGWQGRRTTIDNGKEKSITEDNDYIDEATYQLSAYLPRDVNDTTTTVTAYDAVAAIATWLESWRGDSKMRENGFQPLRIGEIRTPVKKDDSNLPQFNPNFDWRFYIVQSIGFDIPIFNGLTAGGPTKKGIYEVGPGGEDPEKEVKYYRDFKGNIHHI